MSIPGEGLGFDSSAETEPVLTLTEQIDQLFIKYADKLGVVYNEADPDWPVIRVLSRGVPSESHGKMVLAHIISLCYPNEQASTTVILDKMQFEIDSFGARRVDNHAEDPNEEAVVTDKVLEIIGPGNAMWSQSLARVKAREIRDAHKMFGRDISS